MPPYVNIPPLAEEGHARREGAEIQEEADPSNGGIQSWLSVVYYPEVMRPADLKWILYMTKWRLF